MIGTLRIDNVDIYETFGVFITEQGLNNLVGYPALKSVASIDWHEENGAEFDLSNPVLDTKEVSISFAVYGERYDLDGFINMLSLKPYCTFELKDLGCKYRLRLTSQSTLKLFPALGMFTLSFADDFPLMDYTYQPPRSAYNNAQGYEISYMERDTVNNQDVQVSHNLSDYGVSLDKDLAEITKLPNIKANLIRNINSQSGAIYGGENVTFQTKGIVLNCLMRADTIEEFWRNYNGLLFDLTRPRDLEFSYSGAERKHMFIYNGASIREFIIGDLIWCKFSLTLTFIT